MYWSENLGTYLSKYADTFMNTDKVLVSVLDFWITWTFSQVLSTLQVLNVMSIGHESLFSLSLLFSSHVFILPISTHASHYAFSPLHMSLLPLTHRILLFFASTSSDAEEIYTRAEFVLEEERIHCLFRSSGTHLIPHTQYLTKFLGPVFALGKPLSCTSCQNETGVVLNLRQHWNVSRACWSVAPFFSSGRD